MAEEKVLVTLTREELEALATEAALKGAAMVMDSIAKTQEEKLLKMRKRRLHNTRHWFGEDSGKERLRFLPGADVRQGQV